MLTFEGTVSQDYSIGPIEVVVKTSVDDSRETTKTNRKVGEYEYELSDDCSRLSILY